MSGLSISPAEQKRGGHPFFASARRTRAQCAYPASFKEDWGVQRPQPFEGRDIGESPPSDKEKPVNQANSLKMAGNRAKKGAAPKKTLRPELTASDPAADAVMVANAAHPMTVMAPDGDMNVGGGGGGGAQHAQGKNGHHQSLHIILLWGIFPLCWEPDGGRCRQTPWLNTAACHLNAV
jgi:hypothetical protein